MKNPKSPANYTVLYDINFKYLAGCYIAYKRGKMHNKKAQFYILVSAMIAIILTGLIARVNYAIVKPEPIQFYDLSKELEYEANRVIDYGTYNGKDVALYLEDFVNTFLESAQERDPELGLIYIYGNSTYLVVVNYGKNDAGIIVANKSTPLLGAQAQQVSNIKIDIGSTQVGKKIVEEKSLFGKIMETFGPSKTVTVNVADRMYTFDLRGEQYFFTIIKTERENETYYQCTPECP